MYNFQRQRSFGIGRQSCPVSTHPPSSDDRSVCSFGLPSHAIFAFFFAQEMVRVSSTPWLRRAPFTAVSHPCPIAACVVFVQGQRPHRRPRGNSDGGRLQAGHRHQAYVPHSMPLLHTRAAMMRSLTQLSSARNGLFCVYLWWYTSWAWVAATGSLTPWPWIAVCVSRGGIVLALGDTTLCSMCISLLSPRSATPSCVM